MIKELKPSKGKLLPVATYDKFADIDPLGSVLSVFSKTEPTEVLMIQIALETAGSSWQGKGASYADTGSKNEDGSYSRVRTKPSLLRKFLTRVFKVSLRLIGTHQKSITELSSAIRGLCPERRSFFQNKKSRPSLIRNKR